MLGFCIHNVVGNSEVYYKTFHSFFILDIFKNPEMSILQKVNRLLFCVFYEFLKYFLQHLNKNETTYGVKDVYVYFAEKSELLKCRIILGSRPPFLDIFLQNPCRNEYYVFLQLFSTMVVGTKYKNGHFYLSAQLI